MMTKEEILAFLNQYDSGSVFGINEDGITLSELRHPTDFLELGGLPESYSLTDQPTVCPNCGARTDFECLTDSIELHECKHCEDQYYFHKD